MLLGFPDSSDGNVGEGDPGLISGLGRSPGEGNGNPLQYSCLENPMDRGARWVVQGVANVVGFFLFILFILIGDELLYNIVVVFAIH